MYGHVLRFILHAEHTVYKSYRAQERCQFLRRPWMDHMDLLVDWLLPSYQQEATLSGPTCQARLDAQYLHDPCLHCSHHHGHCTGCEEPQ